MTTRYTHMCPPPLPKSTQLVAILDAVYSANERWLERAEAGDPLSRARLVALAVLANGGTVAGAAPPPALPPHPPFVHLPCLLQSRMPPHFVPPPRPVFWPLSPPAAIVILFVWFGAHPRAAGFAGATVAIFVLLTAVSLLPRARRFCRFSAASPLPRSAAPPPHAPAGVCC